ncbi:hypothetical protein [Paludibacterium sp. B53371]|uniref:hypothetical protein n=1 Tax=Paludibacterium sp. B53371 TaxID=2806263 RepID=UPI00207B19AD|nr:hypothetical protein [Paludibacterium sp. B53371]
MMKPHPRNARIKGSALRPNRFIFGDAMDEQGLEPCEYVVHTESPAFVCRLVGYDVTPFDGRDQDAFASALLFDEGDNATIYVCNPGFRLFDFNFHDTTPTAAELHAICDEAMKIYLQLQEHREREATMPAREMRAYPIKPLLPAARSAAVKALQAMALEACERPMSKLQLSGLVQQTLAQDDQAVMTEAQLGLLTQPQARDLLLATARDCIAFPEVVRKDGSILSFELWALPFAFSRAQGGAWWHFPMMERVEPVLADALGLPEKKILWMSPTCFTVEMLNERSCQDLVHLAPVMDLGCDYAPVNPEDARATYEAARQTQDPRLMLAFIPFLVERGALPPDQARRHARKALDAVMPLVQEAIGREMEYGEAELFAPMPWWEALASGIGSVNRKRLGLTLALCGAQLGGLKALHAEAEYQPEHLSYEVLLRESGREEVVARLPWLLVPDVAPDRSRALDDLTYCLREAGVPLAERISRLH